MKVTFEPYSSADRGSCLALFDANCPEFFAPNERVDYEEFLDSNPENYEVCLAEGNIVGAFGLIGNGLIQRRLDWILLTPQTQGLGIGASIMSRVTKQAHDLNLSLVNIATSHKVAKFFAKLGAVTVSEIEDGWGPDMHRIDMELHL